jgi:methionyl-tRNA formyltransferase
MTAASITIAMGDLVGVTIMHAFEKIDRGKVIR